MKVKVIINQWHLKTFEWTNSDSLWICESNRQSICNFTRPWLYLPLPICSNFRALAWEGVYVYKLAFFFSLSPRTYHFLFEKRLIIDWRYFWRNITLSLILERKWVSPDYALKWHKTRHLECLLLYKDDISVWKTVKILIEISYFFVQKMIQHLPIFIWNWQTIQGRVKGDFGQSKTITVHDGHYWFISYDTNVLENICKRMQIFDKPDTETLNSSLMYIQQCHQPIRQVFGV